MSSGHCLPPTPFPPYLPLSILPFPPSFPPLSLLSSSLPSSFSHPPSLLPTSFPPPSLHFLAQARSLYVEAPINSGFTFSLYLTIPVENGFSIPRVSTKVQQSSLFILEGKFKSLHLFFHPFNCLLLHLPIPIPFTPCAKFWGPDAALAFNQPFFRSSFFATDSENAAHTHS